MATRHDPVYDYGGCNTQPVIEDEDEDDYEAPSKGGSPLCGALLKPAPDPVQEDE